MRDIEHNPWCGSHYDIGINDQRICIVGYSHYKESSQQDTDSFTAGVLRGVIEGTRPIAFFTQIRNYFDFKENGEFWNRVSFFNYVPDCIGDFEDRYKTASNDQIRRANPRFLRIIRDKRPNKVLVFTRKGWVTLCPTFGEQEYLEHVPYSARATCEADGHTAQVFGLRHPQFANGDLMRKTVEHILENQL